MKRKGFTLIELLAVIVVLAIIALIATPIVMNTIKKSKKGAAERSADSFIKQVETTVATERLGGNIIEDGEYKITSDGNLCKDKSASCSDENKIKIEMSGTKPSSGKVKITNGVAQISTRLTVGDYDVKYNTESKKYETTDKDNVTKIIYTQFPDYGDGVYVEVGDTIDLNDTQKYITDPPSGAKTYEPYLKHTVDSDDQVTESYLCIIVRGKDKEFCVGPNTNNFEDEIFTKIKLNIKEVEAYGFSCSITDSGYDDSGMRDDEIYCVNQSYLHNSFTVIVFAENYVPMSYAMIGDCSIWDNGAHCSNDMVG